MPTPLMNARAKIYAAVEALTDIKRNLTDAVGRAELRKVIDTLERGGMQLDAAMLEQDADRCTYCGAPPEKQVIGWFPMVGIRSDLCPSCGADIPQPPVSVPSNWPADPDVGF